MSEQSTSNPTVIKIRKGGSSLVTGDFIIEHADGTQEHKTKCSLCRCGASGNMPFCDGKHKEIGFEKEEG